MTGSWLRGDIAAGVAVTALIVPKNLGYAGIAGVPVQNGLYAAAAGAIIYALFCTSRQISTGPSSSLAAVAGGAVLATGVGGEQAAQFVAAITLVTGVLVPVARACSGWVGSRSSSRRRSSPASWRARLIDVVDRRAPEADGDVGATATTSWRELGVVGPRPRRHPLDDGGRRRRRARGDPRSCGSRRRRSPERSCSSSAACSRRALFDLGAHGVALVGHVPRGLPAPALPDFDLVQRPHRRRSRSLRLRCC